MGRLGIFSGPAAFAFMLTVLVLTPSASAQFQCSVIDTSSSTCDGTEIFRMSSNDNAHAGTASVSSYPYVVCCDEAGNTLGTAACPEDQNRAVINLSGTDNAHAWSPWFLPADPNFDTQVCLSAQFGQPYCTVMDMGAEPCPGDLICLASMSSETNAHVGDCNAYDYKICCRTNQRPFIADIYPPSVTGQLLRGDIEFNSTVWDSDGDPIEYVNYEIWYTGSGGWVLLGRVSAGDPDPWNITWQSSDDIPGIDNDVKIGATAHAGGEDSYWYEESFRIDNTPPEAWITGPDDDSWVGRVFDVTFEGNPYAVAFDFEYADSSNFPSPPGAGWSGSQYGLTQDFYQINLSESSYVPGDNPQYCYRVLAVDDGDVIQDPTDWSCSDPAVDDCNCSTVDTTPPWVSSVASTPVYTNQDRFDVDWLGADIGSGLKCYQVEYKVINNKDNTLLDDWDQWSEINDLNNVLVLNDETKGCEYVSCVDPATLSDVFDQFAVEGTHDDNRTYTFRARAIDNVDAGCANMGDWEVAPENTSIDKNPPPSITVTATNNLGQAVQDGDTVMTETAISFSVAADPGDDDYTGVIETGVIYWMYRLGSGYLVQGPEVLPSCAAKTCTVSGTWDDDYNITYMAYAVDRAGNRGETEKHSFMVFKPFDISTASSNIYMMLGSYDILPIVVSNRQDITESVSIRMLDDYQLARFVDISEGKLSEGNRTLNLTLMAKETKTVHAIIYTYDIGDSYTLTLLANSTRSPEAALEITDMEVLDISVVFPPNFSGLSWAGVTALFVFAALLYFRYGTER